MKQFIFVLMLALIAPAMADVTGNVTPPGGSGGSGGITALTGDVAASGSGSQPASIQPGVVSLADMAPLAGNRLIGNNTGGSATPLALTSAQIKTWLALASTDVSGLGALATLSTATPTVGGTGITTYALGDTIYASAANTLAKLSGNTTTQTWFMQQTGDGTNSAAPVWGVLGAANIPNLNTIKTTAGIWTAPRLTGDAAFVVGDVMAAGSTTALSRVPDVAIGQYLQSGGVGALPAYGAPQFNYLTVGNLSAASWTTTGIGLAVPAATFTDTTSTGTVTTEAAYAIGAATVAASSTTTFTSLVGLYIAAPVAGTNVTATTRYGLMTPGAVLLQGGGTLNGGAITLNANTNNTVGIGSGTNTQNITIGNSGTTGKTILAGLATGTNADFLCLSAAGVVLLQTTACTISSLRFKLNVEDYADDAMATLKHFRVATFRMIGVNKDPNYARPQIGLIAENIAHVDPRCAIYEDDLVTPKSYRQECVIALLVAAAQQTQATTTKLWGASTLALLLSIVTLVLLFRRREC